MSNSAQERISSAGHSDFGEKIGGAKKDLWQKRGLLSADLSDMNEREADKYVKKDYIWKKPDYQALVDSGIPAEVVYYIKTIRDSMETAPIYLRTDDSPEKRLSRQMQYIDTVREVQNIVEGVKCKTDVLAAFDKCMINNGYFEPMRPGSGTYYSATDKGRKNTAITDKLSRAMLIRSEWDYSNKLTYKTKKEQFGVPKADKVPKGYEIQFNDGKHSWSANNDWKPNTYYVAKGHHIIQQNLETREEALKWVQDYAQQKGGDGKKRFVPEQLKNVQRDGADYRGGIDVTGEDYLNTFGFKGGEFGNWMNQNDRQASLNFGFDALKDLAAALKISDKDISYQGVLSIAFGARGSGGFAAHYEPMRKVINLTKMNGAGSLAHEWWHGLDDFLGAKLNVGGYMSENSRKHPLFRKLIDVIKYKPMTLEQATEATEKSNARIRRNAESWTKSHIMACPNDADDSVKAEYAKLHEAFLNGEAGSVDKLTELRKKVTGRTIPKSERETLMSYERLMRTIAENPEPTIGQVETDYYRNSKEMGGISHKDGGYWESEVEMTARAFATYVLDTLPNRSDYLAGHAESAIVPTADKDGNLKIVRAYPQGEERERINAVFDEIVAELKLQHYFTHDEHSQPQPERRETPEKPQDIQQKPEATAQPPKTAQQKSEASKKNPVSQTKKDFSDIKHQQFSFFDSPRDNKPAKKPSLLGGLKAAKVIADTSANRQVPGKVGGLEK